MLVMSPNSSLWPEGGHRLHSIRRVLNRGTGWIVNRLHDLPLQKRTVSQISKRMLSCTRFSPSRSLERCYLPENPERSSRTFLCKSTWYKRVFNHDNLFEIAYEQALSRVSSPSSKSSLERESYEIPLTFFQSLLSGHPIGSQIERPSVGKYRVCRSNHLQTM